MEMAPKITGQLKKLLRSFDPLQLVECHNFEDDFPMQSVTKELLIEIKSHQERSSGSFEFKIIMEAIRELRVRATTIIMISRATTNLLSPLTPH